MFYILGWSPDTGISWNLAFSGFHILLQAQRGQVENRHYEIRYKIWNEIMTYF
jgi:hypothetical protein